MTDSYGRKIDYMRISLTDNCNLRCSYCMPEGKIPDVHYLSGKIVLRCVESAVSLGITNFRLTGGEPLIYPDIQRLITDMKLIKGVGFIGLTTNGVLLSEKACSLKAAGIDSINVSLDTVYPDEFAELTGSGCLENVKKGIESALENGITLKLNTVLRSDVDVLEMVKFAALKNIDIRFIEMMPIGIGQKNGIVPGEAVIKKLEKKYGKAQTAEKYIGENGPAQYFTFPGLNVRVGLIQAVHGKFCDRCNRIRITSDAKLKPCLADERSIDLKDALNMDKDMLTDIIRKGIFGKPKSHHFDDDVSTKENRTMNMIGG